MRVSSSFVDHVELRTLPLATDAVEVGMELRCDKGVFSTLGMLMAMKE